MQTYEILVTTIINRTILARASSPDKARRIAVAFAAANPLPREWEAVEECVQGITTDAPDVTEEG